MRISDWSSDVCSSDLREMDMDGVRLRLHRPVAVAKLPIMLYIHGGGWTLFSIDTHERLMREDAGRAGIAVLGIAYSLSTESNFPVDLREWAAALGRIAAIGRGSGGERVCGAGWVRWDACKI